MTALPEVLEKLVPREKVLPDLLLATYHESRGWNDCRQAMLALIREHGPALLRDAGDGWRSIESAPRDGTKILGLSSSEPDYVIVAQWRERNPSPEQFRRDTGWFDCSESIGQPYATHIDLWVPYPAAMHAPGGVTGRNETP